MPSFVSLAYFVHRVAAFSTERALVENWPLLQRSDQLTEEELIFYVEEYARNGIGAALNWYRNRRVNWEDETVFDQDVKIKVPYLFVQALQDRFLPPSMSAGMENYVPNLRRRASNSSHFCQILDPNGINGHLRDWLTEVVLTESE